MAVGTKVFIISNGADKSITVVGLVEQVGGSPATEESVDVALAAVEPGALERDGVEVPIREAVGLGFIRQARR